jgi:hypothetical protein
LLSQAGPELLRLVDAGRISGAFIAQVRARRAHVLGALEAGAWEQPKKTRRLADGSVLAWVTPSHTGRYRKPRGRWVRIISYRVTDARLGEPDKVSRVVTTLLNPGVAPALTLRKVLRSETPEGVRKAPLRHLPGLVCCAGALGRSGGGGRARP